MKKCIHCNAETNDNARFCDSCGIKFPEAETVNTETVVTPPVMEPTPENKTAEAEPTTESKAAETTNEEVSQAPPVYTSPVSYGPYMAPRRHGGLMAFSVINICSIIFSVFTLYASVFTLIFGIIAASILSKAKNEPNDEYYKIQRRNALILNVIGLIIAIIGFIAFMGLVAYFIVTNLSGLETTIL